MDIRTMTARPPLFPNAASATRFLVVEWVPRYGSRDEWIGETGRAVAVAATQAWALHLLEHLWTKDDAWDDDKHYSVWDRAKLRKVFRPVPDARLTAEIPF